jgi:Tfp pilus assembly protein PilX
VKELRRRGENPTREGLALPAVLLALLIIAALIAGAFSATLEETRIGAAAANRETALLSAESAIELTLSSLSTAPTDAMAVGESRDHRVDGLASPVVVHVTRLDSSLYWLVADGGDASSRSGIARRIGVVARAKSDSGRSITVDRIPSRGWSQLF